MFHFNRGLWLPFPRILYDFYVVEVVHGQYGSYMRLKNCDFDDHLKHPPLNCCDSNTFSQLSAERLMSMPKLQPQPQPGVKLFQKHPHCLVPWGLYRSISWKEAFLNPGCWGLGGGSFFSRHVEPWYALITTPLSRCDHLPGKCWQISWFSTEWLQPWQPPLRGFQRRTLWNSPWRMGVYNMKYVCIDIHPLKLNVDTQNSHVGKGDTVISASMLNFHGVCIYLYYMEEWYKEAVF